MPLLAAAPDEKPAAAPPWIQGWEQGRRQALAARKPMLVRAVAEGRPACRQMEQVFAAPEVQHELAAWTLVEVHVDRAPEQARQLHVTVVPAFRIQTAAGQGVAARDGLMSAQEIVTWLKENFAAAQATPDDVLLQTGRPDLVAAVRLVRQFGDRDAAARQAAIGRLVPYPDVAGGAVMRAFREGSLSTRLAAMEVFEAWKTPVDGLDPWQPDTITAERLGQLEQALDQLATDKSPAKTPDQPTAATVRTLAPEQLADARQEFDRLLKGSDSEAEATRDRLARLGPALLEEIQRRLKTADTDRARERLRALRYRLVATDVLALRWPGGLARLAATDAGERRRAAEELARQATADDQPLLLELFSDPDPLVREIGLRGLQDVGGSQATAALVKLLADPEPNVRAAVLKQLEENPQRNLVARVAEYVDTEKNADLLVHAIRFLHTVGGRAARRTLITLLKHESWQVRAEAAAGLTKGDGPSRRRFRSEDGDSSEDQVEVYVALLGLLADPDAFVVSRAVEGLAGADLTVAVEPLAKAAETHPDLAEEIIGILAQGKDMRQQALPHLRRFTQHAAPTVRAAALAGLAQAAPGDVHAELQAALADPDHRVRIAAAQCVFRLAVNSTKQELINQANRAGVRSYSSSDGRGTPLTLAHQVAYLLAEWDGPTAEVVLPADTGEAPKSNTNEDTEAATSEDSKVEPDPLWERWLRRLYSGRGGSKKLTPCVEPLTKMLAAAEPLERVEAAKALVVLGHSKLGLPVLLEVARTEGKLFLEVLEALPWLAWTDRAAAFQQWRGLADTEEKFTSLVGSLAIASDSRAAETLWSLLADSKATGSVAVPIEEALRTTYFKTRSRDDSKLPASRRRAIVAAVKTHASTGTPWQRLVGLLLVLRADPDTAAELAQPMADDQSLDPTLRAAAFQVCFAGQSPRERVQTAATVIGQPDPVRKRLAVEYLVRGSDALEYLTLEQSQRSISVAVPAAGDDEASGEDSKQSALDPPRGLKPEAIRPLLLDSDPKIAADAAYLLTLFGEADGLPLLLRYWHEHKADGSATAKLVYRAVAALDDSSKIGLLKEIYGRLQEYEMQDFYWTIRGMTGPEMLRFRKQIREEVGMDNLR